MYTVVVSIHIVISVVMIGLILVQHGKGADAGASFGAGGSGTVFGGAGSGNFMTRLTTILAALFFVTSLTLGVFAKRATDSQYQLEPLTHVPHDMPVVTEPAPVIDPTPLSDMPATPLQAP